MLAVTLAKELPEAAEVDRAVRRVLARPEFAERELPGPLQWLVDLYISLRDALARALLDALGGEAASVLGWALAGVLAVALVALLAYFGRNALEALRSSGGGRGDGDRDGGTGREDVGVGPAAWEARAREQAEEGRLRESALALYRAVVLRLDDRGALIHEPWKTPGDYRREASEGTAAAALDRFLRLFEPIAFGGDAVSQDAWERLASAAREAGARV